MNKVSKKITSLLMCTLMALSCLNVTFFTEIGALIASAANVTIMAGDINGDGTVNNKDLTRLLKHIAGEDVEVVSQTLDTNGDGTINNKDLTRLLKYIAGENVELAPVGCNHSMTKTEEKEASCTEAGNITYWYCSVCDGYFSDAEGLIEITIEDAIIEKLPHTEEKIEGYPATKTETGLTDGIKCSVCQTVLKEQEIIPISEYEIKYVIDGNDTYLTKLMNGGSITNPNPVSYSTTSGLKLKNISVPGYTFEGWYDAPGASGEIVKEIVAGTTGEVELYAKWTKVVYTVTFDSPEVPWASVTYTVDTGTTLTNPSWFGYTFVGWSEDGKIVKDIPVGTIGNKTLHANWTSDRNKAVSKTLTEPEIIEDLNNNRYLFVYEIGEIENVPLNLIKDYGKSESNLELKEKFEYSQTVNDKFIETAATAVSNATTKTSSWTLSEDWNSSTTATNEHEEEIGKTDERTDSQGNVYGSQYYISNSSGGSTSSSSSAGGASSTSAKVTTDTSTGISNDYSRKSELDTSVDLSVEGSVKAGYGPVSAEVKAGASSNVSTHDEEAFNCSGYRDTYVGTYNENNSNSYWDTSSTSSASWNSTNSYQTSTTSSTNTEVSSAISEVVYDRWGYSSTEDRGGGSSETNSTDETKESTEEYISTIEHSTEERETLTTEINKTFTTPGYYRLVTAGKLHVFAVVGYDVATRSYFTYTYSVLDSERSIYLDYSKTQSDFDDCENAILPFEVPYEVHEFITDVTARSEGLTISLDGIVTKYNGSATHVVIPEYTSDSDGTAANEAIRVRGIAPDAFAGNTTIKAVSLPKYVTGIPNGAFEGCTSLESVFGYSITSVGDNAFAGCTALKNFTVDEYFTSIGVDAFEGVPEIIVKADPAAIMELKKMDDIAEAKDIAEDVVRSAIYSGAKRISVDVTALGSIFENEKIAVDDSTDYFAILNNNVVNTYNNLQIVSNAKETYLGGMKFIGNIDTPLKLNSEKVTLSKVTVDNAPGFALVLPADNTALYIYDTITLGSAGENAIISKNVNIDMATTGVTSKLLVDGNYLICGTLTDNALLAFTKGQVVTITEDQFNSYLTSSVITFDANGGSVSEVTKTVYYGQLYGDLPAPTRANYTFAGWYTAKEGGAQITAETSVTALVNQTLYAHWAPNKFTLTYNANGGSVSTSSKELTFGDSYGTLPTPKRDYYTFLGWYTAASGGTQVSESTTPSSATNVTIYAQWKQNDVKSWVKASEMPAGAQVTQTKWTYTLREYTTRESTSETAPTVSGYTNYGKEQTGWSATQGPVYSDPSNGKRSVRSEKYETSRTKHWVYYRYVNPSNNYGSSSKWGSYTNYEEIDLTYELKHDSNSADSNAVTYYKPDGKRSSYWFSRTYDDVQYGTRWYYQDPIYTYYYYKDTHNKEATSDPTNWDNTSNEVKWVMYRPK